MVPLIVILPDPGKKSNNKRREREVIYSVVKMTGTTITN
jgi:hypothetical protein